MLPPIYSILHTPAVAAIVDDRIGAYGTIGPDESRPYVSWLASLEPEVILEGGTPPADRWLITVECRAKDEQTVSNLAAAVRLALQSACYVTGGNNEAPDPDTGLFGFSLTADFIST